jgi:hypothetical protein
MGSSQKSQKWHGATPVLIGSYHIRCVSVRNGHGMTRLKKSLIMPPKPQSPNLLGVNKLLAKESYPMDEII